MKNMNKFTTIVTGLIGMAFIAGCNHGECFEGDTGIGYVKYHQATSGGVGAIAEAQSAAGAKEDAMLYDMHFHGSQLTSLGEGKLDLIVKGTTTGDPVKVYLNVPHDQFADRQPAVVAFLEKKGVSDKNIVVAEGPNPNSTSPTAYNISGLYKADAGSFNGEAPPEISSGNSGPIGGGGGTSH